MLMKRITHLCMVLFWMSLNTIPLSGWGQTVLNMPQFGKQEVIVSDEITFYDLKGEEDISSSSSNNSYSTVVFKPAITGKAIQIIFEDVDLNNDNSSWSSYPCYMKIYNGIFDAENKVIYPSTTSEVNSMSPFKFTENQLDSLDGTYKDLSYVSTSFDGSLSVCFHFKYAKKSRGWKAKVRSVDVKDMTTTGAGSSYEQIEQSPVGKETVGLFAFHVDTEGFMNADHLTSVSFTLPVNENVVDPAQLKLYAGQGANFKGQTDLGATFAENNGIYTLTLDKELAAGENWFTVAGDIRTDAAFDSKVQAILYQITTASQASGIENLSLATPVTLTVPYVVLMSATPTIYKVGDNQIYFYDDGGKDGNISEKFVGQVTFKPTTEGKKVMIDFTKLDLFNTSSTGLNDILNIYYGDKVDENNLAVTLLKEKTAVIKSIAADGALTVTLKSTTGVPKSGFEAVVSEFVPQPMTVKEIRASQSTAGTVVAGDKEQLILSFNINTENTEPALAVRKLSFTTNNTFEKLSKATLYYTAGKEDFKSVNKVGEVAITSDAFVITVTEEIALREGNNYFWLAYDVKENARTGNVIDATLTNVSCSGKDIVVTEGNPEGNRKVENTYLSVIGSADKTVYGTWSYKHSPQSDYSPNYAGTAGDQIVTFRPGTEGMIMEMEFFKFSIRYYTYAGGDPVFKIYSGTGTTGELLWTMTKDNKDAGPGIKLRSTSADGALTVVFNANGSAGSTGNGWEAEVREYKSKPMIVKDVNAFQASTKVISVASAAMNQEIIGFKVRTEGDQNPLSLQEINLDLKGTQDKVAKVHVYTSGRDSVLTLTDAIVEAIPVADSKDLKLTLTTPIIVPEGDSYYWIAYDMKEGVAAEQAIDAALVSLKLSDAVIFPQRGDPAGERMTKNIYLMGTGDFVVNVENSLMFYDDGGADGKYSKASNGTITFVPKAGDIIKLVFKSFDTYINDNFYIYSGREATSANQLAKYYNKKDDLPDLVSRADDGTITIKFKGTVTSRAGWEIEVLSYTPEPLSLGEVNVTAINSSSVMKGAVDVPMLRIDIEVLGDKGTFDFTRFEFDGLASSADAISTANVYCTDTLSRFVANKKFTETQSVVPYTFAGTYRVNTPGIYKFWLAYDVAAHAALADKLEAKLISFTANGSQAQPEPVIATTIVEKGFSGIYTVGETGDYQTLTAAIDAMKGGIDGPVTFEIETGTYDEVCKIPSINGASPINTITIKSKTGNYQDVTFAVNTYSEPAYGEEKDGMFTVKGADYVTIEGITFTTTAAWSYLFNVKNVSEHLTIRNCRFAKEMETAYSGTTKLLYTEALNEAYMNSDHLSVEGCLFEGGYTAADVSGTGYVALPKLRNVIFRNNVFKNQGSKALYLHDIEDVLLAGNEISNDQTDKGGYNAMDLYRLTGKTDIYGNTITLATKAYAQAVYIRPMTGTVDQTIKLYNNVINFINTVGESFGLYFTSSASEYLEVANNTIRMNGASTASSAAPIYINNNVTGSRFLNNIFQNEVGGVVIKVKNESYLEGITFSNNALYTNNETVFAYAGSDIATFEDWVAKVSDTNSFVEKTSFLSDKVLEPSVAGQLNSALPLAYVTADLAGTVRNATTPTIGAYEFSTENIRPEMAEGYPLVSGIKHNEAVISVKSSLNGQAFFLLKPTAETTPTVNEIVEANHFVDVKKDLEATYKAESLESLTDYVAYVVLQNLKGATSEIYTIAFSTVYKPTEVSTFENVEVALGEDFEDGTASFSGFTVESITDGIETSKKAAKVGGDGGLIMLTNSTEGLNLTGFYLKSDAETDMTVYGKNAEENTVTLYATQGQWIFINLKDKGEMTGLMLSSAGNVYIDNFSGEPQPIEFLLEDKSVNEGETVTLSTEVYGGVAPYIYSWQNSKKEEVSAELSYAFVPQHTGEYLLTVTDAWNVSVTRKAVVTVEGGAYVATFDNLYLEDESYWNCTKEEDGDYLIYSGSYAFTNKVGTSYGQKYWSGFSYSNSTSTAFTGNYMKEQFNSAVGSGVNDSRNYAVAYVGGDMPDVRVIVTNAQEGETLNGCYVSNDAWAVDAILTGDGITPTDEGFEKGDYFTLTAIGWNAEGEKTASVDFYLADYRSEYAADHYYLNTWQWFDLRPLGKVKEVSFALNSSKRNSYGITTPTYFCMDDFNGTRNIVDKEAQVLGLGDAHCSLEQYFTFEDVEATVTYRIEDPYNETVIGASVTDNMLTITGRENGSTELVVSAVQKGKKQFVRLPITIDPGVGVNNILLNAVSIYPVPAVDKLNISTDMDNYLIEVIAVNGAKVLVKDNNSGSTSIGVGALESGVYLLKISNENATILKRFTKVR